MQQAKAVNSNDDREARIEKMYREKQERIARQIALREAPGGPYVKEQDGRLYLSKILF